MTDESKPARRRAKTELEQAVVEAPAEPQVPNGVLVMRVMGDDGNIEFPVQLVGDVKLTEVETILKKGLIGFQQQIGV